MEGLKMEGVEISVSALKRPASRTATHMRAGERE